MSDKITTSPLHGGQSPRLMGILPTPEQHRDERGAVDGWHYGSPLGWLDARPDQADL